MVKTAIEGLNDVAAGYYAELHKLLTADGRLKPGDERALARLCHLYSIADKLEEEVNNAWGHSLPKTNLPLYDKIVKAILSLESAFQMNPNSRKQKSKDKEKKNKAFDNPNMKVG
jgi:phage terminase small subunit